MGSYTGLQGRSLETAAQDGGSREAVKQSSRNLKLHWKLEVTEREVSAVTCRFLSGAILNNSKEKQRQICREGNFSFENVD